MLMQTSKYIPQVYAKERTIQVFTKLLDIILTACKYDIDNIGNVYDAYQCPENLLPLLAYTLNYDYNFRDTVSTNRAVIDSFAIMERWKGSKRGMKMATALSLTSLDISQNNAELLSVSTDYLTALSQIHIAYDYENARIIIDYPNVYTLVSYLLDYVRPVGMWLELRSVVGHNINSDVMLLFGNAQTNVHEYNPDVDSKVNKSFVNFSTPIDYEWLNNISNNETFTLIGE